MQAEDTKQQQNSLHVLPVTIILVGSDYSHNSGAVSTGAVAGYTCSCDTSKFQIIHFFGVHTLFSVVFPFTSIWSTFLGGVVVPQSWLVCFVGISSVAASLFVKETDISLAPHHSGWNYVTK